MIRKIWLAAALLLGWAVVAHAQTSPGNVGNGQIGANYGSGYGANNWMAGGTTSCPAWLSTAELYLNTSGGPTGDLLQIFDGTSCVTVGTLNASAHSFVVGIGQGGTGATSQSSAASNIFPTPTRAGDVAVWNGSSWTTIAGNNSGTLFFSENASGVASWGAPSGSGNVSGPVSSTNGNLATYNGTSGGIIQDQASISTGQNVFLGSGQPWCDPKSQGATGNGSTDDTAAINACLLALNAGGGGLLRFEPGTYCAFSGIVTSGIVPTKTNASTATSSAVLSFSATPANVANGMIVFDVDNLSAILGAGGAFLTVQSFNSTTVTLTANVSQTVNSGDLIIFINPGPSISIDGVGGSAKLSECNHNVPTLSFVRGGVLKDIVINGQGASIGDTAGQESYPGLLVTDCNGCVVYNVHSTGGSNAVSLRGSCDCLFDKVTADYSYGVAQFYIAAISNGGNAGGWLRRVKADGSFPTGVSPTGYPGAGTLTAWATSTPYSLNQMVFANNWYWQCTTGGTSSSTAGGPTNAIYNVAVADGPGGSARWTPVAPRGAANILFGSGAYQWSIDMSDFTGPNDFNFFTSDDHSWGSSVNGLLQVDKTTMGGAFQQVLNHQKGSQNKFTNNTIDTCYESGCALVLVDGNPENSFIGNTIYGGSYGVYWAASSYLTVNDNTFSQIGTTAIFGSAAFSHATIVGNICSVNEGAVHQCVSISGGPNNVVFTGNDTSAASVANTFSVSTGVNANNL